MRIPSFSVARCWYPNGFAVFSEVFVSEIYGTPVDCQYRQRMSVSLVGSEDCLRSKKYWYLSNFWLEEWPSFDFLLPTSFLLVDSSCSFTTWTVQLPFDGSEYNENDGAWYVNSKTPVPLPRIVILVCVYNVSQGTEPANVIKTGAPQSNHLRHIQFCTTHLSGMYS